MSELEGILLVALAKVFRDPRQARFWGQDSYGLDPILLGVIAQVLPPEAHDLPRKYVEPRRAILRSVRNLGAQQLVVPADGKALEEGVRPTWVGLAHADAIARPWWRKAWDRLTGRE